MNDPSQAALPPAMQTALWVLIGACLAIWLMAGLRLALGLPVLPYRARRPVPWRVGQVLLVFVLFELPLVLTVLAAFFTPAGAPPAPAQTPAKRETAHQIEHLLRADSSAGTWLLCIVVAVVIAPIVEEFMYRLMLQGWLEAEERRAKRWLPAVRRLVLIPGLAPVKLASLLFALRHFRQAAPPMQPDLVKQAMVFQAAWSLMTFGFGLWLLRVRSGATAADLGWVPQKLLGDVALGLAAFAAVGAPVILLQQAIMRYVMPAHVAADPIPIFFFALMLGTVYYRTHRIVPAIVTHMALNATSLALLWLSL